MMTYIYTLYVYIYKCVCVFVSVFLFSPSCDSRDDDVRDDVRECFRYSSGSCAGYFRSSLFFSLPQAFEAP